MSSLYYAEILVDFAKPPDRLHQYGIKDRLRGNGFSIKPELPCQTS